MNRRFWIPIAIFLFLALWWTLSNPPPSQQLVSTQAENFHLPEIMTGKVDSLSAYSGKVRLVVFWATWCAPCLAEIPNLIQLQQAFGNRGFQIIAIAVESDPAEVAALVRVHPFNYPLLAANPEVIASFGGVSSIPTSFLINRQGVILGMIPGLVDYEEMEKLILPELGG